VADRDTFDANGDGTISAEELKNSGSEPLTPGDPGYETRAHTDAIGHGAYIDLGFASRFIDTNTNSPNFKWVGVPPNRSRVLKTVGSLLTLQPRPGSQLRGISIRPLYLPAPFPVLYPTGSNNFKFNHCCVFDTWTIEYERDGVDQNTNGVVDEGNDGIDNNGSGGIDDIFEAETMPPYPVPLRGFQVIVRAFQNGQQQTRQFTITHDFTPE
jgi:hypothetical protein